MKNKKADIWISAVIYIAVGITIVTIILSAALPVINKMRDKNIVIQTKGVMHELDTTIRDTFRDGPGGRRTATLKVSRGEFTIINNKIEWIMQTKIMFSEPGFSIREGNLEIFTEETNIEGEYITKLTLDYNEILELDSELKTLSGNYNLMVTNIGDGKIKIEEI